MNKNGKSIDKVSVAIAVTLCVILLAGVLTVSVETVFDQTVRTSIVYRGKMTIGSTTYDVEVEDFNRGNRLRRWVKIGDFGDSDYNGITAEDTGRDGTFDRLGFWNPKEPLVNDPTLSSRGRIFLAKAGSGWMPEENKGVVEAYVLPGSKSINLALSRVYEAVSLFCNEACISEKWEWKSEEGRLVKVYDRDE